MPRETPRCGRRMNRYFGTTGNSARDPVCGMPAGHAGRHLSEVAWRRKIDGNKRRVQDARKRARAA